MTGEKNYLKEVKTYSNRHVTFCDGAKGKIIRKGKLDYSSVHSLDDVLLIEGLIANLISIGHLCDQELCVKLNHYECIISNKYMEQIMKGTISSCNWYMWCPK